MEDFMLEPAEFSALCNGVDAARRLIRHHSYAIPNNIRKTKKLLGIHMEISNRHDANDTLMSGIIISFMKIADDRGKKKYNVPLSIEEWEYLFDLLKDASTLSEVLIENLGILNLKLNDYIGKLQRLNVSMGIELNMRFDKDELYNIKGSKNYWKDTYDRAVAFHDRRGSYIAILSRVQCIQHRLPEITI